MANPSPIKPALPAVIGKQVCGLPAPAAGDLRPWPRFDIPLAVRKRVGTNGALPQYRLEALSTPYQTVISTPPRPPGQFGQPAAPTVPMMANLAGTPIRSQAPIRTQGPIGGGVRAPKPAAPPSASPIRSAGSGSSAGQGMTPSAWRTPGKPTPGKRLAASALACALLGLVICVVLTFTVAGSVVWGIAVMVPAILLGHQALRRAGPLGDKAIQIQAQWGLVLAYGAALVRIVAAIFLHR